MIKNLLKILISLSATVLLLAPMPLAMATSGFSPNLIAKITLDPNLKPENSPGVTMSEATLQQAGSEAAFGNYLLQMLAGGLITVAAPVAIIIIAVAGLIAVVSGANQGLMEKAKNTLKWAVIGLVIIIFSWVIVRAAISIVLTTNQSQANSSQSAPATPSTPGGPSGTTKTP